MGDVKSNDKGGSGRRFLRGWIIGMVMGTIIGWCVRPPESFPIERLKSATEKKFSKAQAHGREELADFAEKLARKLRETAPE